MWKWLAMGQTLELAVSTNDSHWRASIPPDFGLLVELNGRKKKKKALSLFAGGIGI